MAGAPFKVKAIYEYTSEHDDDLTFPIGQVITVTELEGDEWYVGEYTDVTGAKHEGLFPNNFVEKYEPEVPTRPTRPFKAKQEVATPASVASVPLTAEPEEEELPPIPASTKPQPPPVDVQPTPTSPTVQRTASVKAEPPPAPKPAPAELAEPASTPAKKAPPPVAAKSNAFKDRIAAFNQQAAAPIAPFQPAKSQQPSNFIKKPFVAPPPSKNAYIPPPKVEPVHKPYVRDEDPEIREREEEDRVAAEAAGLGADAPTVIQGEEEEDAPKPMTLKERMALLQQQQQEQAQRRAETASKKKPPQKKASQSSDMPATAPEVEGEEFESITSDKTERQSSDAVREKTRVPSSHVRPPEPMSPVPAPPDHEILSDGHEADQSGAGELSEGDDSGTLGPDRDDSDERPPEAIRPPGAYTEPMNISEQRGVTEEDDDEEEDEVDEETRRKEELRARMARLGGGMPGMGAPFNPFGAPAPAPPRRKQPPREREVSEEVASSSPPQAIPPMVPVPGMQRMQSPESDATQKVSQRPQQDSDEGDDEPEFPPPPKRVPTLERGAPPPVPKESRPVPPPPVSGADAAPRPPALESRPVPPPPPGVVASPGPGSESDDEMSSHAKRSSTDMSGVETPLPIRTAPPPVPGSRDVPPLPLQSQEDNRMSYASASEPPSATSDKRSSRVAPPIPGQMSSPVTSPRPPPPPPPTQAPPSRRSTIDEPDEDDRVGSDYDGDYDTDIASSAPHKDALKAGHIREASLTENTIADDTLLDAPAPLPPQSSAPRGVPPPPPPSAPKTRPSMDRPPPPVPPGRDVLADEEYDPYRYTETSRPLPPVPNVAPAPPPPMPPARPEDSSADDFQPPPRRSTDRAPPPPPQERVVSQPMQSPPSAQVPGRASGDVQRSSTTARRSAEQGRASVEQDQIASDLNLPQDTPWWTAPQPLPPALKDRNGIDMLSECEETSKSKRGGKKEITKDIYILYMDYSQTVISARYDSNEPAEVQLEQRHESPPPRLRQDQLEAAWQRFGKAIAETASSLGNSKKDSLVGDGSPPALPLELIKAQPNALLPVGSRAYGALVYANLANASTMQYDEIRRGDIITVRNARFEGHHGAMKTKYKSDYGPSHIAIVEEWDGTRRAVRAWEQGREKKGGVRSEKFRLGDLRSGEVRVWRVVGRDWVGWES